MREMRCPRCESKIPNAVSYWDLTDVSRKYINSGSHEKLLRANALIEEANRLHEEVSDEQQEVQRGMRARYKWTAHVSVVTGERSWDRLPEGTETIRFNGQIANEEELMQSLRYYGSFSGSIDETRHSVTYYRKHGILFHSSGGHLVLEDEQPCSDEEWEALKRCEFGKFQR